MVPRSRAYDEFRGPHGADRALAELAARQYGLVSGRQLAALGLTKDAIHGRLRAGRLHRLHRGVFAVGHEALSARGRELAAVLACGPLALLSHRSAGNAWVIRRSSSARIEVTAPRGVKTRPGITVHTSRVLHPDDYAVVDGIPVTSVARTMVDLAEVLHQERELANVLHEAEIQRVFDRVAVEAALARLPGRKGRHRLERALATYRPEPRMFRSPPERRVFELCDRHGVLRPEVNVTVAGYEVDFYWPSARLVLEYDSEDVHHTTHAFHADRRRDRALAAAGVEVLRMTKLDLVPDEAELARELLAVIARRTATTELAHAVPLPGFSARPSFT